MILFNRVLVDEISDKVIGGIYSIDTSDENVFQCDELHLCCPLSVEKIKELGLPEASYIDFMDKSEALGVVYTPTFHKYGIVDNSILFDEEFSDIEFVKSDNNLYYLRGYLFDPCHLINVDDMEQYEKMLRMNNYYLKN